MNDVFEGALFLPESFITVDQTLQILQKACFFIGQGNRQFHGVSYEYT